MVAKIPNDIFQFSTVSALMAGLATSGPSASQLPGYGTHGIGTFSNMDGEMLYLDGQAWHMTTASGTSTSTSSSSNSAAAASTAPFPNAPSGTQSATTESASAPASLQPPLQSTFQPRTEAHKGVDGVNDTPSPSASNSSSTTRPIIKKADPNATLPFVQVTGFQPEYRLHVPSLSKADLASTIRHAAPSAGGANSFMPILISGTFSSLRIRIGGPRRDEAESLASVTARAPEWTLSNVRGRMFGFWSPEWSLGISVGGWHGHFIEEETKGDERRGGHVLDFEAGEISVEWGVTGRFHLGMPRGDEWEDLDMGVDVEGIKKAEG